MQTQSNWIGTLASEPKSVRHNSDGLRTRILQAGRRQLQRLEGVEAQIFVWLLFLGALAVRMVALLSMRRISQLPGRQEGADGIDFERLARALAEGRGYVKPNGLPTSFRAPGFPMFVSVIYRLTHVSVSAANLSFPVLGAAVCVVTYLLAREVVSERAARLSALLSVFYFPTIYFSTVWLSEPLFMFSCALSLWLFLIYLRSGSYAVLAAAGILLSWSVLVRPFAVLLLPALLLLDAIHSRRRLLTTPLLLVCSLVPTLLWTARNYQVHHAFVLVATNGGSTFYGGNNDTVLREPQHMGAWVSTVHLPGRAQIDAAPNEYAHDQVEWQLGKGWVETHLTAMPLLVTMKLVRFALPEFDSSNKSFVLLSVLGYLPFLPLFIVGIKSAVEPDNWTTSWLVMHIAVAATVVTAVLFWGNPRFRDAAAPMLFIYAGYGLNRLLTADRGRHEVFVPESVRGSETQRLAV